MLKHFVILLLVQVSTFPTFFDGNTEERGKLLGSQTKVFSGKMEQIPLLETFNLSSPGFDVSPEL